jgi:oligopeptide transport system substrate-binding protein
MRTDHLRIAKLLVGCWLLGTAAVAAPYARAAGVLTRGIGNEPDSLDPHQAIGTSASIVLYDLFEGLMTVDAAGKITAGCAESWAADADGHGIRFSLRPNLRWSDGVALTAADFEYSFRRLLAPETAARYASFLYPLKNARAVNTGRAPASALGVRALDARTLRLDFEQSAPQMLEVLSGIAAAPVPRHAIERDGRAWTQPGRMVSNGAFVLADVVPRSSMRVRRNAQYRDAGSVTLDEVRYVPVEDEGASWRRFQTGELQVAVRFPLDRVDAIRAQVGARLHRSTGFGSNMLLLNQKDPALADTRLRRALSLALDRDVLANKILRGSGRPAYSLVPNVISDYPVPLLVDAALTLQTRRALARELGGAGAAQRAPLRLLYPSDGKSRALALAMLAMWRSAGIAVEIHSQDLTSVIAAVRSGQYQIALYAWFSSFDDPATFLDLLTNKGSGSLTGYGNAEFDRRFAAANVLLDPRARGAGLAGAEALALADYPLIPVFHSVNLRLISNRVSGWVDNSRGANLSRFLGLNP